MDQTYSHHHVTQTHHSGLVIGTLAGSLAVTVFVAIAVVSASPRLLIHPLSLISEISVQPETSQNTQLGSAASIASSQLHETKYFYGPVVQTSLQFSNR